MSIMSIRIITGMYIPQEILRDFQKQYLLTDTNFTLRNYASLDRKMIALCLRSGKFHICFHLELKNDE